MNKNQNAAGLSEANQPQKTQAKTASLAARVMVHYTPPFIQVPNPRAKINQEGRHA